MTFANRPGPESESGPRPTKSPPRIERMLVLGRLREHAFTAREVAALWEKAVQSGADAELPALSLDGALRSAYHAGHLGCLALLAAHGLRPGGGPGHHEMAFAGAAALGGTHLEELVPESEEVRLLRTGSVYDPTLAEEADREHTLEWVKRTLPAIRTALLETAAELGTSLTMGSEFRSVRET